MFTSESGADNGTTDTFTAQATQAGDAIVIHAYWGGPVTAPTSATLTAAGWNFTRLGPVVGSGSQTDWAIAFGAIAPDTALATLGDEFANNDITGGTTTFAAHAEAFAQNDCTVSISPGQPGDAVWAGCSALADDGGGNWTESRITTSGDGTTLPVTFPNQVGHDFIITSVTIKHR